MAQTSWQSDPTTRTCTVRLMLTLGMVWSSGED